MLNAIAGSLITYFIFKIGVNNGNATNTKPIPEGSRVGTIDLFSDSPTELYGLSLLAIVVGVGFWVLLNRTRFGFDLRASGASESAAVASGVNVKRMIVIAMLLSGAVAGLVGLPTMFSDSFSYGSAFQTGLGFTGIAVALLGRNNPVGIAFGALIFAFLSEQATLLNILAGISPDIVYVTQGVIVLRGRDRLRGRPPLPGPSRAGAGRRPAGRPARRDSCGRRGGVMSTGVTDSAAARGGPTGEALPLPSYRAADPRRVRAAVPGPGDHRRRPAHLVRHPGRHVDGHHADRDVWSRRSVVRTCRRGQHRPRRHADHGHARGGLLRLPLRRLGRRPRRHTPRAARRRAARAGHRRLRRRPHRLRCGHQHHRPGSVRLPRRGMVQRTRGWRPDAVAAAADAAGDRHLVHRRPDEHPRGQALVPDQRPRRGRGDVHQGPQLPRPHRAGADLRHHLGPVAHPLRPAPPVLR